MPLHIQPKVDPFLVAAKQQHKDKIAKAIEIKMGRPPVNAQERRKRSAATDILAGDAISQVERRYAIAQTEINQYIEKVFPTDDDRFKFLEDCLLTNASLAGSKFVASYDSMNAEQAAGAMTKFANAAIAVKKARENGFKEAPINVGVILSLQETLKNLLPKQNEETSE